MVTQVRINGGGSVQAQGCEYAQTRAKVRCCGLWQAKVRGGGDVWRKVCCCGGASAH